VLHGDVVTLRELRQEDLPRLAEIINHPDVARWWEEHDVEQLRREFFGPGADVAFAIVADDEVVGVISYGEVDDPDYRSAGMDISVASEHQGRGLGSDALRTLGRYLIEERRHWRLTIDPDVENARAIRVYERIGFRPVGVMRRYERRSDGSYRDGLLMDLLADELRS
jgi:aminoglycoside 6'-N-acetyltransferase